MLRSQDRRFSSAPLVHEDHLCILRNSDDRSEGRQGNLWLLPRELGRTKIHSISPNDQWLFDNLRFKCSTCLNTSDYDKALTHPNSCPKNEGFQPPEHIHNWTESKLALMNVTSNPIIDAPPRTKDGLIRLHYKGEQVFSKFIRCNNDIGDIKTIAARM